MKTAAFKMIRIRKEVLMFSFLSVVLCGLFCNNTLASAGSKDLRWGALYSPSRDRGTVPVGEWKFDGNWNNENSGGPDASPIGGAIYKTSGGISNGYAYIQTDSAWIEIPHSTLYDLPNTFTIEFWFRQRTDQTFSQNLVQKDGEDHYNFLIYRRSWDGVGIDDGAIIAGFTSDSSPNPWMQVSNPNNPAHDVWHYVAYAKSATAHAYYIDGNLVHSADTTDLAFIYPYRPIEIATTAVDTDIDELRIYDTARTEGEISSYYNSFAPTANAGSDQTVHEGNSVTLHGTGSTIPAGTTVTYQWTQTAGTTVTITNPTSANAGFTAPTVGGGEALTFQITLTNNAGQESTDTCIVYVQNTSAPGTYYVNAATGSDTNDGSAGHPWKTLHHAVSQINGGTSGTYVLHVALGTYHVSGSMSEADEEMVLRQNNVTIIGERGSGPINAIIGPIIDGTSAQNWTKGLEITGSNAIIKNFYVTGFSDTDEEGIRISGGTGNEIRYCNVYANNWGIRVNEAASTTIKKCDIYNNSTHGIDIVQSTGTTVVRNKIHGNPQYGIRVESSPEISRNEIYDNQYGIFLDAVNGSSLSPSIKNNVIYEAVSNAMSYGIFSRSNNQSVVNPKIYHNTIDGGKLDGIKMEKDAASSSAPLIKYNIITNFGQYGINNNLANPTIDYNDVYNNTVDNYSGIEVIGTHNISENPSYGSYSLLSDSPCINTIPSTEEDPVTLDYPGYKRPRPGGEKKDMGAYEYVANAISNYTLPGGTGLATDYRIFTVPLILKTGAAMLDTMEYILGPYNPAHWRAFLYTGTLYWEFNSSQFASHTIKPGMGFWIITTYTDTIPFEAKPAPDGVDFVMELEPGWHLIGLPWIDTSILLSAITVTDGVYTYAISSPNNNLTQRFLWDFTGDGPFNGYEKRSAVGFRLQNNKGYFFRVLADKTIRLIIPHADNQAQDIPIDTAPNQTNTNDDEEPPPPPGAEPVPDIKANGQDGPVAVSAGDSVSVSVSLDPGAWSGQNADWWVAAYTPFDPPLNWYTYAYPGDWRDGIHVGVQRPLSELITPFNVLNMVLPVGDYTFYFAVDGNMDGKPDVTWMDSVDVSVKER